MERDETRMNESQARGDESEPRLTELSHGAG